MNQVLGRSADVFSGAMASTHLETLYGPGVGAAGGVVEPYGEKMTSGVCGDRRAELEWCLDGFRRSRPGGAGLAGGQLLPIQPW
jgi:hypothetical protein